jgi:hypothetical protein
MKRRMAAGDGHPDDGRNLERLHQAKKALAEEWKLQAAQGHARERELRTQPAEIKEEFKTFYKRLPDSKWDLLSGNYELQPLIQKREDLNVVKSIGIGAGIGVAVLLIGLAIVLLILK